MRYTHMNKLIYICFSMLLLSACGLNKQVDQLKAFEDCKYELKSADSMYIANIKVADVITKNGFDLAGTPRLALALLRKDVPFTAKLNLLIKNPSSELAGINQFEYKVLFKNHELANGIVDRTISVSPNGGETLVPIKVNSNLYSLLSDKEAQNAITDFILAGREGKEEKKGIVTIKIKPTIGLGGKMIKYPGYITIDKEISSKILL